MNVSENMHLGPDFVLNRVQQIHTPRPVTIEAQIAVTQRRSMREKHIDTIRDAIPLLLVMGRASMTCGETLMHWTLRCTCLHN